jgi:hypothetical protein
MPLLQQQIVKHQTRGAGKAIEPCRHKDGTPTLCKPTKTSIYQRRVAESIGPLMNAATGLFYLSPTTLFHIGN